MKRMIGVPKQKKTAQDGSAEDNEVRRTDFLLFLVRAIALFTAVVCSAMVVVACQNTLYSEGTCHLTQRPRFGSSAMEEVDSAVDKMSDKVKTHVSVGMPAFIPEDGPNAPCHATWHMSLVSTVFAGVLFIVCAFNLVKRKFKSHASCLGLVQMVITALVFAAMISVFAMLQYNLMKACEHVSDEECSEALNAMAPGLSHALIRSRNAALGAIFSWLLVLLFSAVRYFKARKRSKALQAELDEERREKREKILAADAAQKKAAEGKGFVERMLM